MTHMVIQAMCLHSFIYYTDTLHTEDVTSLDASGSE